jgi:tetratricopeptide (TPR) repeat protein
MADGAVAEGLVQAEAALAQAERLDPTLAETHATRGMVRHIRRDFAGAELAFAAAYAANPNYATAHHWHAIHLACYGRLKASEERLRAALRLDPLAPVPHWTLGCVFNATGRPQAAWDATTLSLQLRPGMVPVIAEQAIAALALGRREEALAGARAVVADTRDPQRWSADSDAVYLLRQLGAEEEATRFAEQLLRAAGPDDYRRIFVLAALGRWDEAFAVRSLVAPSALFRLYTTPMFDPVREDPRFRQLLERNGVVEEYRRAREEMRR